MKENLFFGRKTYLDILDKRIGDLKDGYHQNIAITGDELVGKTSIIFEFLSKFYDNRIVILYLEVRPESLPTFARRFMGVLLYNFLLKSNIALKEDLDYLLRKSARFIPKTCQNLKLILNALDKRKKENVFTDLLSLCEIFYQETGKFCVVIFDEFHNLENLGVKNIYREWSRLLILQKNTMYIIVSSMKFKAKTILAKNLSLLFGNFEAVLVEPFDTKTSEGYLESMLSENINSGLKNFIVHFTGGCPLYLKLIADELAKSPDSNLVNVLESLLFEPVGILNQRFSNYLKRFLNLSYSQDYISILYSISSGHNRIKDIGHILHKTKNELSLRINSLLELDSISRSADFLKINDRVFAFWLKFVYQEKLQSLTFDAKNQKALFRGYIDNSIQDFLINAKKPVVERMLELLRLFEDEVIQIDRNKLRLSRFREIKHFEFNNKSLKEGLIGRSHDSLWIMAFKNELLTEEDIAEFTKECKRYRYKPQRKIIVALRDIDNNARLRALEERILTWDVNNLNLILDLFSKPRIVI